MFSSYRMESEAGRIAVGVPTQGAENAWCPIALDGLERCHPIAGETPLQALLIAISFFGIRLHDFLSHGGRVLYVDDGDETGDQDVPLSALFGPLLRAAEVPAGYQDRDC